MSEETISVEQTQFDLVVVTPDKVLFEGSVKQLIAPGEIQDIAILPNHTPLYSTLKQGSLEITDTNNQTSRLPIEGGIIRVKQNQVTIIAGF